MAKKAISLEDLPAVGARLKQARKARGLTQVDVGQRLGVSQAAINRWEMGKDEPPPGGLVMLASLYAETIDWLLTGRQLSSCAEAQDCMDLPDEDTRPLQAPERAVLKKALAVLRTPGVEDEPDVALFKNINAFYGMVKLHRLLQEKSAVAGGEGSAGEERGSAGRKPGAAAGGAKK